MPTVRRATQDDVPTLAATLASAFADYAWTRWIIPADDHLRRLEALFTLDLREVGLAYEEVWMTEDGAAVAVWLPPKCMRNASIDWERHAAESADLLGEYLERANAADLLIAPLRPEEPHWYLATTGTRPDRQRQGLGSAVLAPVLERCDAEGVPALTETSTPENVAFYRRFGFEVIHEIAMPEGGPPVWMLWREPRNDAAG